jgi:restriction system protein
MHLNWKTDVAVPHYGDPQLNAALQRRIRAATDDDLLASLLHFTEGRIALDTYQYFDALLSDLKGEEAQAEKLREDVNSPLWQDHREARQLLLLGLRQEITKAEAAANTIARVWHLLREATTEDLARRYQDREPGRQYELDAVGSLIQELPGYRERLAAILARHREDSHALAIADEAFQAFTATPDSISGEDFDRMNHAQFEQAVADLAERDGYIVARRSGGPRDLGADVIATTPDGRRIVFQCKHRQPGGRPLGSPVIQTLNGTARPVHNADIVVAVTNASFTGPAHDLAQEQDIHLLFGHQLRRWATWGVPLLTVLDAETPAVQHAA